MKIKPFSSIGGLMLMLQDDAGKEIMQLRVPKDSLVDIASACLSEISFGFPPNLVYLCAQVVEQGAEPAIPPPRDEPVNTWRGTHSRPNPNLTKNEKVFLAARENKDGQLRREGESFREYYDRAVFEYNGAQQG